MQRVQPTRKCSCFEKVFWKAATLPSSGASSSYAKWKRSSFVRLYHRQESDAEDGEEKVML